MASKPIDPRPVALPNLSQLPDPTKDLFGGMTSPTALMSMNEKEVTDLFSVKPLTDMQIKPSAEAAKALQTAQQTQEAINRQAQQAQKALARREQEIAEQRQRSIDEQIKLVRKAAEERRKALEEKKEQQGGKLGAAPDGSFVLTKNINEVLSSQEWNSIVSDKQRGDQAETYLSKYAAQLKEMGATDEQVAAEIENGRGIFKAHTDVYRQGMMKDKSPIHDTIVEFAGGAGSLVTMLGGGAAKLVGADTVGDYLLDRNERIQSAVKDVVSSKVKLQAANKDYESEKYRQQYNVNPEIDIFDITGSTAAVKLAYQNGTLDSLITEQLPNILTSLGIGGAGKVAAGKFATTQLASKLPTATKILTGNLQTGSRILDKLVLPAASGSGLALGGYGALSTISDAGSGAWQAVRGTDFKTIKEVYGESTWATAVKEHGSEEAAREALADEAFNRAAKKVAPVALATSFLGLESTIAGMMTRQAVKDEAKKLTLKGVLKGVGNTALTAAEEGFEEGYTQYASNVGANPYTGIALDSGVSDAIGIGALMGGGTAAVTNALSSYAESKAQLPSETFIRDFVSQGNYNDAELKQKFERQMAWFEKQYTRDGDTSVNDVQHYKQTYYNKEVDVPYTVTREDGSTDTKTIWDLMTPEQAQSFRDYVRLNYGINTNDYARHQDTVEYDAIKNNNMEVLSRPENADLLNVWRILNNTDTDQIPADKRDYYTAMAETTAHLRTFDNTHNTFQREAELLAFVNSKLSQLDDVQRSGVFDFGRTVLGANSRRFTDAEQQAWNELQQEQSNGTNEQNQTDNSQSGGQGPIDENAESVAEESVRTDTSQATTLHQAAEELADAFSGRPASPDAQSVGNDNPRQGTDPSSQTNTPTTNGAGVAPPNAGAGQAQATGITVNPTTPEIHSGTSPQSGNTGQTNQGGQSVGPTVAPATQTTTGGGSVGTPPTKRNSNGRSKQTSVKNRAIELGKAGVEIDLGFIVIAYENPKNKLDKKGLIGKGITALVREQAGTPNPDAYQVLQHLTKLPDSRLTSILLNFEYEDAKGNKRKLSQSDISSARANRYNLLLTAARAELKNQSTQSTTDTNTDNGSQGVDEANFADTVDENPQAAVEQPVQTADDVETVEQAQEDSEQGNVEQANEPVQITYEMMMSAFLTPQERKERQLPTPQIAGLLEYKPTVVERQEIEDLILDAIPSDAAIVDIIRQMAQDSDVTYDVMLDLLISNNPTDFSEANTTYDGVVQSLKNILTNVGETQNEQPEPSSPQQTDEPSEELGKTYTIKRRPAQETDTSITETETQPGNRTKLSATLLANNDVALNSINSYIYVKREGETGVIYKRGKRYYFSAFGGTSDIHIGDHNTDKTLGEMRIKAYSFGRFPNQVRNAIHHAGRYENTIWTETYNAVFNPNITEQEVEELLVQSVQEPILDYNQELEVAYGMLVDLLGSEANVAEYMQKYHADDLALLEQTDDVDGLVNLMLEAAVAITDTKLYDDYKSNYFLADTVAEESGVTDLLDQLIDGLQSEPVQVRTEVLADFIDWAESEKQTTPVADEMNVARPNITLETAPIFIKKAVEGLTTKPSKRSSKKLLSKHEAKKRAERFKERHSKLIANIPTGKMSDRLSTYRSNDMAVRVEYGNTVKIGQLIAGTEYSVKFDDGTGEIIIPRPKNPQATFNTYNEDSDIKLYPAVPLYLTADFIGVTNGNQRTNTKESGTLDVKNTTTQQGTTAEVPSVSETATNRREKVVSQDKSGKWRLQVANNRLPAVRGTTALVPVNPPKLASKKERVIELGTTQTGLSTIALGYNPPAEIKPKRRATRVKKVANQFEFDFTQEQSNAEPRESSPTTDTATAQDRAGASGLAGDTQTTASQAEPVKPKWSGRSKKKTTPQLEIDSKQNNTGVENFTDKQMNALYSFAKEIGLKGQLKKSGKFIPARAEEALSNLRELATTKPRYFNTLINLVGLKAGRLGVEYTQILRDLSQLTPQEQSNAEENDLGQSVQPTQERTADDNEVVRTRTDNEQTNDAQGEVSGQGGQAIGGQSQTSGTETTQDTEQLGVDTPTYYTDNLTAGERNAIKEIADNDGVDVGVVYQAITDGNIRFFSGRGDSQGASLDVMAKEMMGQDVADNMSAAKDFIARLTTPPVPQETQQTTQKAKTGREPIQDYLKNNPREHDTIRSYFNEQRALAGTAYDNAVAANNVTNEITSNYNLFNGSEIDFIEKMLGDRPFTDENIAQVIADTSTVYTAGITFDSLPTPVQNIIRKIWDKIKSTVAAISMALAISTGTTLAIPTEANAATLTETAVVQNIVSQNDNQGKQFIVADKQAGTLTVYTPLGQQITSTPALFGKATGDSISTNNATPSGRYDMNFTDGANIDGKGYGSSAQALSVNGRLQENNAGNVAIHRVLPIENRQGRLDSATATDNRISHGCINVPSSFYDTHLDRKQDTVVYVMPETDAGRTGVFNVLGTSDLSRSENSVPTATQTTTDTKEQVDPAYDNANSQSVEVTPEQLTNATPHEQVKVAPKLVPTPLIIKGAEQSTQVAYTTPTVLGGANGTAPITADRIVLPKIDGKVVHTPAEQRADTSFDTEPVKDKTDDGISLAEVAVGLAAAFAGGVAVAGRRKRAKAKKLESIKRTPVADNPPPTDSTPTPDPTPNMPQDPPTTEQVQDTVNAEHNEQVNKSANNGKSIPTNIKAPPQPTATALAVNREMWLKYLVETNQLGETGSQEMADMLLNTLRGFEYANLAIMTDKSYEQANDGTFKNHRHWGDGEVNTDRVGVFNKLINIAAGAAPIFDNLMGKLGIARGGHEADSSLASIALAQVKSKALGAYAQIHKFFVNPMLERSKLLAQELRRGDGEIKLATGRVATANHILNEAADAMWKGFEAELAHRQDSLDKVNADLAANPSNKDYPLRMMNTAKQLENEIRRVSELYTRTRNMYEGKTAWDGETKLPGGMTKARAEQDIAEVKAEYGADYAKIEENVKELTKSIRGIRQFATAAGVFTNDDIEVFNELGFDEYVPLYSEEKDPTDVNEEDDYTQSSLMDRLLQGIPLTQARSMGLTKDLSRYRRKGAKSPAADGFTNMEKFAMNMAGRIGQQNWVEMNQQLYEGTVGKPYSTANITDPVTLADLNASYDSGKVPGLIRVRPGMKDFLPADVKAKIDKVRPIMGKGRNANGDTVAFEYYWTEPAIQAEIYANTDLTDTLTVDGLRNIGTATRAAARLVTVGKPVWNLYNFVRDSFERVSVMLMRPVKDQSGNLVPKWKLATEFFRALPTIVLNSRDIYRYLVLGEVKTPLQIMLNEAVGEGAINLMTTQTEKHSVIGELKKSDLEKAGNKISKWLGDTANKTGAGGVRNALTKGFDFYIVAMTEIPQVSTALASYMAYQNVGVNKKESANRVRDAYDPNRTNNEFIHNLGQFHPFVRSTFSGHYNLARSLTQYWKPGEWQFTLAYTLGGTLGVIGLLSILAGAFDDDDDGRSALARLPLSTLMGGIPVPWGENGVWTLPVGFGINKFIWGIGANFYRYLNGYQSAGETAMGLAGLLVDNTSPVQATGGSNLSENPTAAAVLTTMPMLLKPIVEMGFNTKAYGGGKIYGKDTPRDQLDSQQDNFNTPETYKKWASWLNENGFGDFRPETLRHLFESYSNLAGPLTAIPQAVIADQSEKTLGNKERKGEVFGATLTALGAGMSIQPNALDIANLTYEMDDRRYELHRKYGVGESHADEIYERYAQRGKRGGILKDAKYVTEVRLREKGVPEEHIKYIINGMKYQKKREELDKEFKDLALEYNRLVASGKEDLQMRQSVQNAWDALEKLTNDYVKENNNVFFTLRK